MPRTPIGTAHDLIVLDPSRSIPRNTEVRQLHATILVRQDVCAFNVTMYDSLVVQIYQSL